VKKQAPQYTIVWRDTYGISKIWTAFPLVRNTYVSGTAVATYVPGTGNTVPGSSARGICRATIRTIIIFNLAILPQDFVEGMQLTQQQCLQW
jgi:hypothetical protein